MDKSILINEIENYINNSKEDFDWKLFETELSDSKAYYRNLVERLIRYYDLYIEDERRQLDFLIALRCFLVSFQVDLHIERFEFIINNELGLGINGDGNVYASMICPSYLNEKFVSEAFQLSGEVHSNKDDRFDLKTNSYIEELTGIKKYYSEAQKLCVMGVLRLPEGFSTLAVLPTGGGKSLITQTLAYKEEGLTIVIVPTISLALDQEISAKNVINRITTEEIYSYSSGSDKAGSIIDSIKKKTAKLLFISPEALIKNEEFSETVFEANKQGYLKNIVIDEAHIVIEWGDFFRTDYQALEPWRKRLKKDNPKLKTVLLSATIDKNTGEMLKKLFSEENKWMEFRCDLLRKEPRFCVVKNKTEDEKKTRLLELIKKMPHPMIIYTMDPERAEIIKKEIVEAGIYAVETFTGDTRTKERDELIRAWKNNEFDIMVATSAFGMGVDKPDVRTVIHVFVPDTANLYYQELGRGGRDGLACLSIISIFPEKDFETKARGKVLTVETAYGRWKSMYLSPKSKREENYSFIDTKIKPTYNYNYIYDEASSLDVQWNIYVLLLFRRYNLIELMDMEYRNSEDRYIFKIRIIDKRISQEDSISEILIKEVCKKEKERFAKEFYILKNGIMNSRTNCISDIFVNIYPYVLEYCAGCDSHNKIVQESSNRFELVKRINYLPVPNENTKGFDSESLIISDSPLLIMPNICQMGVRTIISERRDLLDGRNIADIMNISFYEFRRIVSERQWYFLDGICCVVYSENYSEFEREFQLVEEYVNKGFKIVHIVNRDYEVGNHNKKISSIIGNDITKEIMEGKDV